MNDQPWIKIIHEFKNGAWVTEWYRNPLYPWSSLVASHQQWPSLPSPPARTKESSESHTQHVNITGGIGMFVACHTGGSNWWFVLHFCFIAMSKVLYIGLCLRYRSLVPKTHFLLLPENGSGQLLIPFSLKCAEMLAHVLFYLMSSKITLHIACQQSTSEMDIDWATLCI